MLPRVAITPERIKHLEKQNLVGGNPDAMRSEPEILPSLDDSMANTSSGFFQMN